MAATTSRYTSVELSNLPHPGVPRSSSSSLLRSNPHSASSEWPNQPTENHPTWLDADPTRAASASNNVGRQSLRSMSSPIEFHNDAIHVPPEEHVVALHDFTSSNATCLSFAAGQIIKVYNRDSSGWWDGELDGQRGWFPSNYVDQEAVIVDHPSNPHLQDRQGSASSFSHYSTYDEPRPSSIRSVSLSDRHRTHTGLPSRSPTPKSAVRIDRADGGVLDPILHAMALLHNAVRANRVAHFQPSTACVISSVRSVLSATDCLTRESPVLKSHPVLARERKSILSELSRLVTQARKASVPMVDESLRDTQMELMLSLAELVLDNVRRFLQVALDCGVSVPDRRSSVYDDLYNDDARSVISARSQTSMDRHQQDKTPTPNSPRSMVKSLHQSSHYSPRNSKSHGDLRHQALSRRRKISSELHDEAYPADLIANARSLSHEKLVNGRRMVRSQSDSSSESPESVSACETGSQNGSLESYAEPTTPGPIERTPQQVMQRLSSANDQLLSIIAAFIGHVHTHTAESHASSYAHLIDMTREAVDGVRNLLLVVEAVNNNAVIQAERPRETSILWETRESLYEATTTLVTAARIITSAPSSATANGGITEAEEKSRLLQAATGVLRTGGECVGAVRLCIEKLDHSLKIVLSEPTRSYRYHNATDEGNLDNGNVDRDDVQVSKPGARRGKHTLSFLGRKATSLTCLKEKYERDGYLNGFEHIDEVEPSDDHPTHTHRNHGSTSTTQAQGKENYEREASVPAEVALEEPNPVGIDRASRRGSERLSVRRGVNAPKPINLRSRSHSTASSAIAFSPRSEPRKSATPSGDLIDSNSEPMSRDHSRASGSTMRSIPSEYTDDTSARPSLEQPQMQLATEQQQTVAMQRKLSKELTSPVSWQPKSTPSIPVRTDLKSQAADAMKLPQLLPKSPNRPRAETMDPRMRASHAHASINEARYMAPNYGATDVVYNSEGQVTGATLSALVEKMTPHDTMIDPTFSNAFFICFRMFTCPNELLDCLIARFDLRPPKTMDMSGAELARWNDNKLIPVRLRVLNFLKSWLETHWHGVTDHLILDKLIAFTEKIVSGPLAKTAQRLTELAHKRLTNGAFKAVVLVGTHRLPGCLQRVISSEKLRISGPNAMTDTMHMYAPSAFSKAAPPPPATIVSKAVLSNLKVDNYHKVNVLDFDPLELTRQLTIMDSKLYCAIQPEELLGSKFSKRSRGGGAGEDVNVKSMSSMSTRITGWISECILGEIDTRKRTQLLKFFIKLGDRCESLNNFHTLMAIQCALNSSTIARLKKTWDGLSQKYRAMMEQQRRTIEHTRNYAGYRARLRNTSPPSVPFLGLFLTDLTFCHEGNAATRPCPSDSEKKLLNFDKYVKISRIVGEMQRFQVPYNLVEVAEIQSYLKTVLADVASGKGGSGADDLYRRSLLLEPRSGDGGPSNIHSAASIAIRQSGNDGKHGLDIFNWRADKA